MTIITRSLGLTDYEPVWHAMQAFTDARDETTADEIWFTEHQPVFTLGVAAGLEHVLAPGDIPVVQIDRGGQVTYHGPGQLMVYPLLDLRRAEIGVRSLVTALEQSVVDLAAAYDIPAESHPDAPGVYCHDTKLASVGLRVRRGSSFHGMAVNVDMDLEPFTRINPCGYSDLEVSDFARLGANTSMAAVQQEILPFLLARLGLQSQEVVARESANEWLEPAG